MTIIRTVAHQQGYYFEKINRTWSTSLKLAWPLRSERVQGNTADLPHSRLPPCVVKLLRSKLRLPCANVGFKRNTLLPTFDNYAIFCKELISDIRTTQPAATSPRVQSVCLTTE